MNSSKILRLKNNENKYFSFNIIASEGLSEFQHRNFCRLPAVEA